MDLFINITLCYDGCIFNGIDYELMVVNCLCNISSINNDKNEEDKGIILNNNKNKFPKELPSNNLILVKCTNLIFDTEILKTNIGFYFSLFSFTFETVFLIIFAKNGIKSIKNFVLVLKNSNPPKLKKMLSLCSTNKNNESNKEIEIQKTKLINQLLNKKSVKKIKRAESLHNDVFIVKNVQSESDDFFSNRKLHNNSQIKSVKEFRKKEYEKEHDKKEYEKEYDKKEYEKEYLSEFESDNESKKEKVSIRSRKKVGSKKNNLVLTKSKFSEKPKYKKDDTINPIDMDILSLNIPTIHREKDLSSKTIVKISDSKSEKNDKDDYDKKKKKKKKISLKGENVKKSEFFKNKEDINSNKKEEDLDEIKIISYKDKNKNKEIRKLSTKVYTQKNINNTITTEESSLMEYEEAIKNDKRSLGQMYIAYLFDKNLFLNTFISKSFINLRTIKINIFFFRLEVIFLLNALFYTDKFISKAYYNNGKLKFFTSLPKAIYSFFVSIIATIIIKFFTNNKNEVYEVIKKKDDKKEYISLMNALLKKIKIKFIIYSILQIASSFFFLYYVTAFCSVYQNSNLYWLYGCLETLIIDFIISFIYCLLLASLRYYGIYNRLRCFYDFGNLFDIIL